MKMKYFTIFLICAGILGLWATLQAQTPDSSAKTDLPPAGGQQLWTYISETNSYQQWEPWPGLDGMYPGKSPHGAYLKLYVNPIAHEAAEAGKPMPAGAILVKENYDEDQTTLMAVTPMYKVEGYNPDAGDWFWAKYGPDGNVMDEGRIDGCISCHNTQEDYIFSKMPRK